MRKYIILIIGFTFIAPIHAQEGLKLYNAADTLYAKTGEKYAVRIINELSGVVTYYLESDPTKAERKVNKNQLNEIFRIRTNDRKAYQLDTAFLLGKRLPCKLGRSALAYLVFLCSVLTLELVKANIY